MVHQVSNNAPNYSSLTPVLHQINNVTSTGLPLNVAHHRCHQLLHQPNCVTSINLTPVSTPSTNMQQSQTNITPSTQLRLYFTPSPTYQVYSSYSITTFINIKTRQSKVITFYLKLLFFSLFQDQKDQIAFIASQGINSFSQIKIDLQQCSV